MYDIDDPESLLGVASASKPGPLPEQTLVNKRESKTDWEAIEKLFVEGDRITVLGREALQLLPTEEIARRTGMSNGSIRTRAARYKWRKKQTEFLKGKTVIQPKRMNAKSEAEEASEAHSEESVTQSVSSKKRPFSPLSKEPIGNEGDMPESGARPTSGSSAETILLRFIDKWEERVQNPHFNLVTLSVNDLDKAVRLLAFVRGQADSIKQTHTTISLEVMQERHKGMRMKAVRQLDDDVAGVLGKGDTFDTEGVTVKGDDEPHPDD